MTGDLTLRELRYFVAVYQARSFSAAARALTMTQPPLSQAIASLERTLGVKLFERSTRELRPTTAAEALYPEAVDLLQRAAEAPARLHSARAAGSGRPTVRIGATTSTFTAYLGALLPALTDIHPAVTDLSSLDSLAAIADGRLDLAISRENVGREQDERLLVRERQVVAVPEGHRFAERTSCTTAELRGEPLIVFERAMAPMAYDAIATCFRLADVPMRPASHIHSEQAALGLVRAGLGISIVTELLTHATWDGIRFVELADSPVTVPLWAVVAPCDPRGLLPIVAAASRRALARFGIDPPEGAGPAAGHMAPATSRTNPRPTLRTKE